MKIPNFINMPVVDEKGEFTAPYQLFTDTLNTQMQQNLSDDGFVNPSRTTDDIALLGDMPNGTVIHDETTNELKVKLNGTFEVIQIVP